MSSLAVEVVDLGKRYRLGAGSGNTTLREHLSLRQRAARRSSAESEREVWALRNVAFTMDQGDVMGVIGRNGAGKSTLLKILARITEPSQGQVGMRGRVGSLLEVGTGFHEELTGRENIFLNGAVLGMSRRDIQGRFEAIVDFAGVSRFLDLPIKRYSSGMKLRLAFAVAAHLEPEVVIVDEVLAVGDAEFQRRCLGKMSEMRGVGRTVLFVSHDLGAIGQLCPRTLWLDGGRVEADGPTDAVIDQYQRSFGTAGIAVAFDEDAKGPVTLTSVVLRGPDGAAVSDLRRGEPFSVAIDFYANASLPGLDAAIYLVNARGIRLLDEALSDHSHLVSRLSEHGAYRAVLEVPGLLASGEYAVGVWLGTSHEEFVDREVIRFELRPRPEDRREAISRPRVLHGVGRWRLEASAERPHPGAQAADGTSVSGG